jgi:hypothetical protein
MGKLAEGPMQEAERMKSALGFLVALWIVVGALAAFQRGDFTENNCSTATDTLLAIVVGPLNYTVPESLEGMCSQPVG